MDQELEIDGRALSSLRVIDLKDELDKRNLSKSGTKKELLERLRSVSSGMLRRLWRDSEFDIGTF